MSKSSKSQKSKTANEPIKKRKISPERQMRRGNLDKSQVKDSPVVKQKKIQKRKSKDSVKWKIDFDIASEEQVNLNEQIVVQNNAQENNSSNLLDRLRTRNPQVLGKHKALKTKDSSMVNDRVQWTHEFMGKVRKSNEKHKSKANKETATKDNLGENLEVISNVDLTLQAQVGDGDGIVTAVDTEELEELDYEDDLSIEDEVIEEEQIGSPRPGTSGLENYRIPKQTNLAEQAEQLDQDSTRIQEQRSILDALTKETEDKLVNNPVMQRMMQKFFEERFKDVQTSNAGTNRDLGINENIPVGNKKVSKGVGTVKSPSDTTIYAPALNRRLTPNGDADCRLIGNRECPVDHSGKVATGGRPLDTQLEQLKIHAVDPQMFLVDNEVGLAGTNKMDANNCTNHVEHFIETVRSENHPDDSMEKRRSHMDHPDLDQARSKAERSILEAEKFRATVEPPGKQDFSHIMNIGSGVSDDDFFHLTCHIEPSLIHKIEKGEFVELEKLLPKDKIGRNNEESRLEWVQRDGGTYLVPAQRDNKIGGFRHWEQAFRAYATIYC